MDKKNYACCTRTPRRRFVKLWSYDVVRFYKAIRLNYRPRFHSDNLRNDTRYHYTAIPFLRAVNAASVISKFPFLGMSEQKLVIYCCPFFQKKGASHLEVPEYSYSSSMLLVILLFSLFCSSTG